MPGTGTGLILIDMIVRPLWKVAMKFPLVGLLLLIALYGSVAYFAFKSAYLSEH